VAPVVEQPDEAFFAELPSGASASSLDEVAEPPLRVLTPVRGGAFSDVRGVSLPTTWLSSAAD
jgi:hypothetical protein